MCGMQIPATIRERAQNQLRNLPYSSFRKISCDFFEGRLILRGRVPSYFLKQLAQTIAAQVGGVESIVNQIEVQMPQSALHSSPHPERQHATS